MTETTTAELRQMVHALEGLEGFEAALRRRTEGILWMVWGLALAAIGVSYYALDLRIALAGTHEGFEGASLLAPWIGWVLAAGAISFAVWRSAALHAPALEKGRPWLTFLGTLLGVMVGFQLLVIASWPLYGLFGEGGDDVLGRIVTPPTLMGIMTLLVAWRNPLRFTDAGVKVARGVGLAQVAAGVLLAFFLPAEGTWQEASLVFAGLLGGTWIVGGLWETLAG